MINTDIRSRLYLTDRQSPVRAEVLVKFLSKIVYILIDKLLQYQIGRFGGVVNTLPCYMSGNPFGGVGSNPAGDETFFFVLNFTPLYSVHIIRSTEAWRCIFKFSILRTNNERTSRNRYKHLPTFTGVYINPLSTE